MIYLDNSATTKPLADIAEYALGYSTENYFNPSALYSPSIKVKEELEKARDRILSFFGSQYDLIFTSGGTEADNTAVYSFSRRGNAVTTLGEHSAVFEAFKDLKSKVVETRFASLNKNGSVNEESLLSLIDDSTAFVSVVHVNNETGAVNDINRLAKLVKEKNGRVVFHSDGVQAFCKTNYKVSSDVDLYSVSAHKINAFKGTGALIKKRKLNLTPFIRGGGQESGLRSGTENVFGILAFSMATDFHLKNLSENVRKFEILKEKFLSGIDRDLFEIISDKTCSPHIISLSAKGLRGEVIQHMLEDYSVIVGTGSACSSRSPHSRILTNCGYKNDVLGGALRISFSHLTSEEDVIFATEKLNECAGKLKSVMKK